MVVPFLSVYLSSRLGFSLAQTGWVMGCFGVGSVVGALVGGRLTDIAGHYRVQYWSLCLSGVAFVALGLVSSFIGFCVAVFIASTIADAFRPANFAALADYAPEKDRTRALALVRLAVNLGWSVGPAVGGLMAAYAGYYWLFWADGLTCLGAGLFVLVFLPKQRPRFQAVTAEQEETLQRVVARSVWQDRLYLFFLLLTLLNAVAFMQFLSSLPVYFRQEVLLTELGIGRLLAMNGLVIAFIEMPLVYILEKRFRAGQLVIMGSVLIGLAYSILYFFGPSLYAAIVCMLTLTLGEILSLPFIATIAMRFGGDHNRGRYMALFTATYSVSHIIAPILSLQLAGGLGFNTLWWVLIGLCVLCSVGFHVVRRVIA